MGRENQYTTAFGINWGETTTYTKTPGTAEDTAFCVITIDAANQKIYADHYGAGYSRILSHAGEEIKTYTVTNTLTNVSTSNSGNTVSEGTAYSANLTASSGYTLTGGTVKVTMGGTDITSTAYSNGKISIASVTGNIVITASAVAEQTGPVNQVKKSIDTDKSIFNGTGYKEGYRLNSSGVTTESSGSVVSGFIPYSGQVIRVYGTTNSNKGENANYVVMYKDNFSMLQVQNANNWVSYGATWEALNGKYLLTIDPAKITNESAKNALASTKYIRASLANCTGANFVVTLNEAID